MIPAALPDGLSDRLAAMIALRTGLRFPMERRHHLETAVASAARAAGAPDAATYADRLLSTPWNREVADELAPHLTVGETYFFRDDPALQFVVEHLATRLDHMAASDDGRRDEHPGPRVWSAGCATGEEPYSLAMLLDRRLGNAAQGVTILASDIDPVALRAAAAGIYRPWSLRATPDWARLHFACRADGSYELAPRIRDRVSFSSINLAESYVPTVAATVGIDVIVCRNVLIYFTDESAKALLARFAEVLAPGGLLVLGPVEQPSAHFEAHRPQGDPDVVVYRLASDESDGGGMPEPRRSVRRRRRPAPAAPSQANHDLARAPARGSAADATTHAAAGARARALADRGSLDEAAALCRQAVAGDRLDPGYRYLLASIERERGRDDAASASLEEALRLYPGLVVAHVALSSLMARAARHAEAAHHLECASALLAAQHHDDPLPEGDGLTVGELAPIVEAIRATRHSAAPTRP